MVDIELICSHSVINYDGIPYVEYPGTSRSERFTRGGWMESACVPFFVGLNFDAKGLLTVVA